MVHCVCAYVEITVTVCDDIIQIVVPACGINVVTECISYFFFLFLLASCLFTFYLYLVVVVVVHHCFMCEL